MSTETDHDPHDQEQAHPGAPDDADGHGGEDHSDHTDHAERFRHLFWRNLWLGIPVVVFSETVQSWLGIDIGFPGSSWIPPVLGTVIFVYGGRPFLEGGWSELKQRSPGMMLLISLAISVAFAASVLSLVGVLDLEFWWELAALIVVMLLGHWQEMKAIGRAQGALAALAELLPDEAERVTDSGTETVKPSELEKGDVVLVRSGSRVPADGRIVEGAAEFDESMLTGESKPVLHEEGDDVVAGSVATDNTVRVEITAIGDETALGGIQRLVKEAQETKTDTQLLADRAAGWLFYVAVGTAAITVAVWLGLGRPDDALTKSIAVLVIACPHALGLAIPLVVSISTNLAADNGLLIRDRDALEEMRLVDTVLFDKTGTLTAGSHRVTDHMGVSVSDEEALALAAAVERDSEHPLARAIVDAAGDLDIPQATDFRSMTGRGVEATIDGRAIAVGGPSLLSERGLELPEEASSRISEWEGRGAAVLAVLEGDSVLGLIALEDEIRAESRQAVSGLHERGVAVVMITGDSRAVADHVAGELGLDDVFAEVLPEDKDEKVKELQDQGKTVAMVGDGVNDAPALARADVGLAIGAGTDVAIESAGIIIASDDPRAVESVIDLSEATYDKMIQNLWWAAGYNIVAIPLAAGVFAWAGLSMPPAVGAALMSASTVIVAFNAQLLRRVSLREAA